MRNKYWFGLFLVLIGCTQSDPCRLKIYEPDENFVHNKPVFWTDSIGDCSAFVRGWIRLSDGTSSFRQRLRVEDGRIQMQLLDKSSNEFVVFDANSLVNEENLIDIVHNDVRTQFSSRLEAKTVYKGLNVYIFRIMNFAQVFENVLDAMFFVTIENGVIGSYLTSLNKGKRIILGPAGEILKNQIDYSGFEERRIL